MNLQLARALPALLLIAPALLSGCGNSSPAFGGGGGPAVKSGAGDDVVVIAVIDSNINPYHFDYLAAHMPQHLNDDPADDLPLDQDPASWLPGHPGAAAFKTYEALELTLTPDEPHQSTAALEEQDRHNWSRLRYSEGTENADVNMYWVPGTKIVGHVVFGGGGLENTFAVSSHGIGTSSVAAGNLHGTCPRCVLVYVHGTVEEANAWVSKQDWIDLQTNSFGAGTITPYTGLLPVTIRDLIYAGSDTELQRQTIERGQQIFFSGGNGLFNDFSVPHTTLFSSQKGPDWLVVVGAISPDDGSSFSGHGKPVDVASVGTGYPSAYGGNGTTTAEGDFSGTSNASPVVAGLYAAALARIREQLDGPSRKQADGVIAAGPAGCNAANASCALADGQLTVHELREALYRSARYTETGWNAAGEATLPATENVAELEFLAEGHGSFWGRLHGDEEYQAEVDRIVGYVDGSWFEEQDADQRAWMVADALCRQGGWGEWAFGYSPLYEAPAPDPAWPVRTWMSAVCPSLLDAFVTAERAALP